MLESSASPVYTRRRTERAPVFEPPLDSGATGAPAAPAPRRREVTDHAVVRLRGPHRSAHDGRSPDRRSGPPVAASRGDNDADALRFAERSVRLVLEVIDGRRPLGQLRSVVEPTVLAAVETLARTGVAERRLGAAVLVTMKAAEVTENGAEVFGGYERGRRRFAIAARLVLRRGRWRIAALRMR